MRYGLILNYRRSWSKIRERTINYRNDNQIVKVLKKKTVAESVENENILNIIKQLGCNLIQGYYFGKPMDEKSFVEFCKNFPHK